MSGTQHCCGGGFVEFADLHPEQTILDNVTAADAMHPRQFVQFADQRHQVERSSVQAARHAGLEAEGPEDGDVGSLVRGPGQGKHLRGRFFPGVDEVVQIGTGSPEIAVHGERTGRRLLQGQMPTAGIGEQIGACAQIPQPQRSHHFQVGGQGGQGGLQAQLVVSPGRGAMGDAAAAMFPGGTNQFPGDDKTPQRGAEEATTLVDRVGLQHGHGKVAQELFAAVGDERRPGPQFQGQFPQRLQVAFLAEVQ